VIAVDTNVLVRILIEDPGQPEQVQAARALASQTRKVYVPLIVMVECV
jgi:predicted nucleic-acid-binding protein